jgi:hypothetical protein
MFMLSASEVAVYAFSEGCLACSSCLQMRLLFPGTRRVGMYSHN